MLSKLQYNNIKKYKRYFTTDLNMGSKLYYDKDLIHKIFYETTSDFERILYLIDNLKLKELVEVENLIYKNNVFVGYSIKNYKEYKSLKKLKNRDFELKRNDCLLIANSFNKLLDNNLGYNDFHLGNVLLNKRNNDIKICDLDSLTLIKNNEDLNNYLKKTYIFVLSYLYQIDFKHIRNVIDFTGNETYLQSINIQKNDININNILEQIQDVSYEEIKKDKKLVISKSKTLMESGYKKFL